MLSDLASARDSKHAADAAQTTAKTVLAQVYLDCFYLKS